MQRETVEVVAKHALFRRLSQNDKAQLLRVMQEDTITPNALVFQEDARGDSLYIIVKGTILLQRNIDHSPVPLAKLQKGESFGELAAINPGTRLLTAKAIESGLLVKLSADGLAELEKKAPQAALDVRLRILDHFLIKIRHLRPAWEALMKQGIEVLDGRLLTKT